ncbi:DUF2513 domain-containing protein [Pseudomonas sp. B21-053]|uniref:DUF2513 domain-containing protein n=1 Tax=Pseudomonas sp. B21-053 TaxID=2895493 RepID=UPI0022324FD2|nr:DUF2513 domain-containing protein [Pseudomonas sp. B21-053]UZE12771.1 DUF2513 domain-containing protein [Pseudomonas sp. B21-053]
MRRNLNKVRHLLELIEKCPEHRGVHREALADLWIESGNTANPPLDWNEFTYLLERCIEAGKVSVRTGYVVLTWDGHDWLDRNRDVNF